MSDNELIGKKTNAVPAPDLEIGIDTNNELYSNIVNMGASGPVDVTPVEGFTQLSQHRDQTYMLLDTMAEDSTMAAVLETYAEDATEYNDQGNIVWADASDPNVLAYINYILETLRVDKNIYKWVYSLCKYGDVYLRLYHESTVNKQPTSNQLNEQVNIKAFKKDDKFVHYVEMVPNPAEMFEITRFGKTAGYIEAKINSSSKVDNLSTFSYRYKFNKNDVNMYPATEFVHASLDDNQSRTPEEVTLFESVDDEGSTYSVKRGQSLLQKAFKIWRQIMLMENSILLNRITKSALVRVVNVEVGDMPKENVGPHIHGIKSLFEQKAALNTAVQMNEYTNPGPMENTIYVPTHGGIGTLSTQEVGGNPDVRSLADLDYFKTKLYGAVRVPKQYLGDTDDAAGFNGGTSLSIVSSRYAKLVKRIQNSVIQALTDIINILLLDKGLDSYINKFQLHITPPTTQEELDRRENIGNKMNIVRDVMDLLSDVEDTATRLTILKSLLSDIISDEEVLSAISDEIDKLEETPEEEVTEDTDITDSDDGFVPAGGPDIDINVGGEEDNIDDNSEEVMLPSIEDTGIDMADNTNEI